MVPGLISPAHHGPAGTSLHQRCTGPEEFTRLSGSPWSGECAGKVIIPGTSGRSDPSILCPDVDSTSAGERSSHRPNGCGKSSVSAKMARPSSSLIELIFFFGEARSNCLKIMDCFSSQFRLDEQPSWRTSGIYRNIRRPGSMSSGEDVRSSTCPGQKAWLVLESSITVCWKALQPFGACLQCRFLP